MNYDGDSDDDFENWVLADCAGCGRPGFCEWRTVYAGNWWFCEFCRKRLTTQPVLPV
jgi:hypothetical protein